MNLHINVKEIGYAAMSRKWLFMASISIFIHSPISTLLQSLYLK